MPDGPSADEVAEDMELLSQGMRLLEADYIGGSGSRGYGRIKFHDIQVARIIGNADDALVSRCQEYFRDI